MKYSRTPIIRNAFREKLVKKCTAIPKILHHYVYVTYAIYLNCSFLWFLPILNMHAVPKINTFFEVYNFFKKKSNYPNF